MMEWVLFSDYYYYDNYSVKMVNEYSLELIPSVMVESMNYKTECYYYLELMLLQLMAVDLVMVVHESVMDQYLVLYTQALVQVQVQALALVQVLVLALVQVQAQAL